MTKSAFISKEPSIFLFVFAAIIFVSIPAEVRHSHTEVLSRV